MTSRPQPTAELVNRVRELCTPLPDVVEHEAWTGTSWRTHDTTFAHILHIDDGWPPAYAAAFDTTGPTTVVTFQTDDDERQALGHHGPPFHLPPWRPGIVGLEINTDTDWSELAELVAYSHRICRP